MVVPSPVEDAKIFPPFSATNIDTQIMFFFFVVGRFLCSMLEIVMRWHGDKKTYEKVSNVTKRKKNLSVRRFWGKRVKREAKSNGETTKREKRLFSLPSPSPLRPNKSPLS